MPLKNTWLPRSTNKCGVDLLLHWSGVDASHIAFHRII
jgi:hypothetical protein